MSHSKQLNLKALGRAGLVVLLPVVLAFGAFVIYAVAHNNFHMVSPGKVYRSGQMSGPALDQAISEHGIKSILNLRGSSLDQEWYQAETNRAQLTGTAHYDFSLSAGREVSDAMMERIVAVMNSAPKPLLIHCKNGADRSGLMSALYLYCLEGKSANQADRELTVWYGHIPHLFWRDTIAMDRSFWRFVSNHVQQPNLGAGGHPLTQN